MIRAAPLLLLSALAGCGEAAPTVIDGSSPAAFARTTGIARNELPYADRLTFDEALRTAGGRRFARRDSDGLARTSFDGLTAAEVVAEQRSHEEAAAPDQEEP
ncbi:hypothetical protein HMF7854_05245 [Sphingomonas ginkgonis]|uniref:Uncharacterized protein n=1 Tax=Sphingomonas ginkgonis TaxID=2315330 RepID=A0A429V8I5_9SPHN|nr:hypothetical protein [Sphingomonas ginkgonis]RST30293.1 hypothetical protein HMF7854_05245 [Sphingomonas ginkgonis]